MTKKKNVFIIILTSILAIAVIVIPIVVVNATKYENDTDYFRQKLLRFEEENASISSCDVVFIGDSWTDGYDIAHYYSDISALNRGIGGDRTKDVLYRLDVSVYEVNPKVLVLLIGGNDMLAGRSTDYILRNYEKIIKNIRKNLPDTRIICQSYYAVGGDFSEQNVTLQTLNDGVENIAKDYGLRFVDVYSSLYNEETQSVYDKYTADSVHLTSLGYDVVTNILKPVILQELGK